MIVILGGPCRQEVAAVLDARGWRIVSWTEFRETPVHPTPLAIVLPELAGIRRGPDERPGFWCYRDETDKRSPFRLRVATLTIHERSWEQALDVALGGFCRLLMARGDEIAAALRRPEVPDGKT